MNLHCTHCMVKPPYPDKIRELHAEAHAHEKKWSSPWKALKTSAEKSPNPFVDYKKERA